MYAMRVGAGVDLCLVGCASAWVMFKGGPTDEVGSSIVFFLLSIAIAVIVALVLAHALFSVPGVIHAPEPPTPLFRIVAAAVVALPIGNAVLQETDALRAVPSALLVALAVVLIARFVERRLPAYPSDEPASYERF